MYFVHLLISLRSIETFLCKKYIIGLHILMVLPTANLLISWFLYIFVIFVLFNSCSCSHEMDKEATEATIKHHAAEHLKHAPGRKGGGGHTGVENN